MSTFRGRIVDIFNEKIFSGEIIVDGNRISDIIETNEIDDCYILPGLVDSHIHIESSMLIPSNFSKIAIKHGTVATISDPHEIANVMGEVGLDFMVNDGKNAEVKFFFGVPSCVPATNFESSGAVIDSLLVKRLISRDDLYFLSEMMNYPGVLNFDREVIDKINYAKAVGKKIDGHAPGLKGSYLESYINSGISTDHECFEIEEAIEKIKHGMIVQIREGSAAKNFEKLHELIKLYPKNIMLCSDDLHPDDLLKGHMNLLLKRSVDLGYDLFSVIRTLSLNPIQHYNLPVGILRKGDPADFIVVKDLKDFEILKTVIDGILVYDKSNAKEKQIDYRKVDLNRFFKNTISEKDIEVEAEAKKIRVINVIDGELITGQSKEFPDIENDYVVSSPDRDILKLVVQNRYEKEKPAVGFIRGFGFKNGGIISTIAHDNHNIVAVAGSDKIIVELVAWINKNRGGIAVHDGENIIGLSLPVAGIMSDLPAKLVAEKYSELDTIAKACGCKLEAPFMTLSFMSLLVIPELKLGNKGLFDVNEFEFTSLFCD